jgi:hypothetical protein
MRFKSPKRFWLNLALLFAPVTSALATTAAVAPFAPFTKTSVGGIESVYYPSTLRLAAYYINARDHFDPINFAIDSPTLNFTVSGFDATNRYLYVMAETTTPGQFFPVPIRNCPGALGCAVQYQVDDGGTTNQINIGISPLAICKTSLGGNPSIKGCLPSETVDETSALTPGIALHFVISTATTSGGLNIATEVTPATTLVLHPQRVGPVITSCPLGAGFFPGDGTILIESGGFVVNAATTTGGSSNSFVQTFVAAQEAGPLPMDYLTATLFTPGAYGAGQIEVGPFENSTNAGNSPSHPYTVDYGVQDSAGFISFCGVAAPVAVPGYPLTNVFSTDIQGFLKESNCFVATASYRNGRAPGVMLLRNFRDEVLSRFDLGRGFIGWYYTYGPIAADWLIEHPIFRSVSLMLLMPLQAMAWVTLHPAILLLPLIAFIILLGFLADGMGMVGLFFLAALLAGTPKASATDQPYIDALISQLPKDQFAPTATTPDPYVQSIKQKMGKVDDGAGYTEEMRKQIGTKDGSEGYSDRLKRGLPPKEGSAIEDYRKGRKLKADKGDLNTRSAFGFNLMASANRTYTAGERQNVAYEEVYGNGWIPDFTFHYEWRPFTGDFIKKFGLYGSLGAAFTKAKGRFNYVDTANRGIGAESHTEFRFISIPANLGLIYRFSLFGFMWPYFAGGPSVIGFTETRNDKQKGHHGYDFGYWFMGGVAFGLDWISPKSSWDQYETTGVKHSYFTIDYSYLESVSGGLVEFTVDGIQAGFTFEL